MKAIKTLKQLRFWLVTSQRLLPNSWLRQISMKHLRTLWKEVCCSSCDQLGGYHSDGCHQMSDEFYRRRGQHRKTVRLYIHTDEGYLDEKNGHHYLVPGTKLQNFMKKMKLDPVQYKYRCGLLKGHYKWVGPTYIVNYRDVINVFPQKGKVL